VRGSEQAAGRVLLRAGGANTNMSMFLDCYMASSYSYEDHDVGQNILSLFPL
jgi:hypothetical protein